MQIDVFTLLPHAFAWLTEQRPVAAVLGSGLDLRFLNYRDYTPLTGGQVDDEPYGGGAGMVLRVDVVCADNQYPSLDEQVARFIEHLQSLSPLDALHTAGILSDDFWLRDVL